MKLILNLITRRKRRQFKIRERAAERGRLILPERFYLLKKEAELISEAVGDEPAEKDKNQKAADMGKDNKQEESGKA